MTNSLNQGCTSTPKPWVLVPVKAFSRAKTRLANEVLQEFGITSAQLAESMLEDVLHGLAQVPSIGGIAVVSSQPNLRSKTQGIELITEEASASNACGLNAAIKLGIDHLTDTHTVLPSLLYYRLIYRHSTLRSWMRALLTYFPQAHHPMMMPTQAAGGLWG